MLALYAGLTKGLTSILTQILNKRTDLGKEDPQRLTERMGKASRSRPKGALLWLHAASVGEAQSALILINRLLNMYPNLSILVTSGTVTSAKIMAERLPNRAFHHYVPLDHPDWVNSFLDHWMPDAALWMESELWPTMLSRIKEREIPLILINGRLSQSSFRNWLIAYPLAKQVMGTFDLILAQTEQDARHFKTLGAQNIIVTDNLKYSAAPLPYNQKDFENLNQALQNRPCWVYASTHAGEEELACRLHERLVQHHPDLLTIIVPRHPERRHDVQKLLETFHCKFCVRGQEKNLPSLDEGLYLVDTLGELGLFYKTCPIAMIGRSFSDDGGGGHNPLEAAHFDCAILTGPNIKFQQTLFDDLIQAKAAYQVSDKIKLYNIVHQLLTDTTKQQKMIENARDFAQSKTEVITIVLDQLAPFLSKIESQESHSA